MTDLKQLETMTDELVRLRQDYLAELADIEQRVAKIRLLAEAGERQVTNIICIIEKLKNQQSGDWWRDGGENPNA